MYRSFALALSAFCTTVLVLASQSTGTIG